MPASAQTNHTHRTERALIVCTRIPEPGHTKTRMMPDLSPAECVGLHYALLRDVSALCLELSAYADIFIAHTPGDTTELLHLLLRAHATFFTQSGSALGERMYNAMKHVFARGYSQVLMIGADIPEISPEICEHAFELLENSSSTSDPTSPDVVLGPARDGGFYLIGMHEAHPEAFSLAEYSHDQVFRDTKHACEQAGLHVGVLRALSDLDTIDDVTSLLDRAELHPEIAHLHTVEYLKTCAYIRSGPTGKRYA